MSRGHASTSFPEGADPRSSRRGRTAPTASLPRTPGSTCREPSPSKAKGLAATRVTGPEVSWTDSDDRADLNHAAAGPFRGMDSGRTPSRSRSPSTRTDQAGCLSPFGGMFDCPLPVEIAAILTHASGIDAAAYSPPMGRWLPRWPALRVRSPARWRLLPCVYDPSAPTLMTQLPRQRGPGIPMSRHAAGRVSAEDLVREMLRKRLTDSSAIRTGGIRIARATAAIVMQQRSAGQWSVGREASQDPCAPLRAAGR